MAEHESQKSKEQIFVGCSNLFEVDFDLKIRSLHVSQIEIKIDDEA